MVLISCKTISVRDNAYNSNSIELKADGTTQIWDGVNNTWIYGAHDHRLIKLSFNVEGGVAPQALELHASKTRFILISKPVRFWPVAGLL